MTVAISTFTHSHPSFSSRASSAWGWTKPFCWGGAPLLVGALGACAPALELTAPAPAYVEQALNHLLETRQEVGLQYLVVTDSSVLYEFAGGVADAATLAPVTAQTTFLSASSTKVLTAAAVLQLVESGALRLDDALSRYVSEHPYGDRVNLGQLLEHSSGVPNPVPLDWVHTLSEHPHFNESAALSARLSRSPRLEFAPGSDYGYSNLGYWLLGRVVERVSGSDLCSYFKRHLFAPLQLEPGALRCEIADVTRHARGHVPRLSLMGLALPWVVDARLRAEPAGRWARFEHLYMDGLAYGGIFATARGYGRFLQDLLREQPRLMRAATRDSFLAPRKSTAGELLPTTLGWHRGELGGHRYVSKPGGGPGVSSNLRIYPERGLATVFLSNRMRFRESEIQAVSNQLDAAFLR